ncbi:MAG: hypothetical protein IPK96_21425 [Flammeovirgaceae bacterium]|nr:hypothetical protein [Flammeovirgaceae bacterium]
MSVALAASYRWYKDAVFTGITANNIVLSTAVQSGAYTVEPLGIATSFCVGPLSDPTNVLVNPLPTATVSGRPVCGGVPARISYGLLNRNRSCLILQLR